MCRNLRTRCHLYCVQHDRCPGGVEPNGIFPTDEPIARSFGPGRTKGAALDGQLFHRAVFFTGSSRRGGEKPYRFSQKEKSATNVLLNSSFFRAGECLDSLSFEYVRGENRSRSAALSDAAEAVSVR